MFLIRSVVIIAGINILFEILKFANIFTWFLLRYFHWGLMNAYVVFSWGIGRPNLKPLLPSLLKHSQGVWLIPKSSKRFLQFSILPVRLLRHIRSYEIVDCRLRSERFVELKYGKPVDIHCPSGGWIGKCEGRFQSRRIAPLFTKNLFLIS